MKGTAENLVVDLGEMKRERGLNGFELFQQPRLSMVPVPEGLWKRVCEMGGRYKGDGENLDDDDEVNFYVGPILMKRQCKFFQI